MAHCFKMLAAFTEDQNFIPMTHVNGSHFLVTPSAGFLCVSLEPVLKLSLWTRLAFKSQRPAFASCVLVLKAFAATILLFGCFLCQRIRYLLKFSSSDMLYVIACSILTSSADGADMVAQQVKKLAA